MKRDSEHERKLINDAYFKGNPDYVPFRTEDIKYIVVPNKDEVIQLIHKIRNLIIKDEEKYKLIQLIIDLESIEKDF